MTILQNSKAFSSMTSCTLVESYLHISSMSFSAFVVLPSLWPLTFGKCISRFKEEKDRAFFRILLQGLNTSREPDKYEFERDVFWKELWSNGITDRRWGKCTEASKSLSISSLNSSEVNLHGQLVRQCGAWEKRSWTLPPAERDMWRSQHAGKEVDLKFTNGYCSNHRGRPNHWYHNK